MILPMATYPDRRPDDRAAVAEEAEPYRWSREPSRFGLEEADVHLIREQLRLTPTERLLKAQAFATQVAILRHARRV